MELWLFSNMGTPSAGSLRATHHNDIIYVDAFPGERIFTFQTYSLPFRYQTLVEMCFEVCKHKTDIKFKSQTGYYSHVFEWKHSGSDNQHYRVGRVERGEHSWEWVGRIEG